ncbi:MAG: mechanosensitive ion channel family protein [Candidatus Woesearchaeota archaeon]|jgi:MscS family membrane protein
MGFLENVYFGNSLSHYFLAIAIILLSIIVGKIAYWIFKNIFHVITKKTETKLDDVIAEALENPVVFFIFYLGFNYAYRMLYFSARAEAVFKNISFILLVINIAWVVINIIDGLIKEYFVRIAEKTKSELDNQLLPVIRTMVKVIIIIIAAISVLDNMGFDIASLLAGLGIGGLAFALAAQDTLKNFFGGVAVFADKPFKVGDRIKLDDVRDGFVKEIGVRSTKIETFDGTYIIVPNGMIANSILENVSKEKSRRIKMILDVEYGTSTSKLEKGMNIVKDIIKKNKKVSDNSFVTFDSFGDSSLKIQIIYWITDLENILQIKNDINIEIKKRFEKEKIAFAFPSSTIYLRK